MHQRYHLALHVPLTLPRIHLEGSELKALKSALQSEQSIVTKLRATGLEGKAARREEPAESFRSSTAL